MKQPFFLYCSYPTLRYFLNQLVPDCGYVSTAIKGLDTISITPFSQGRAAKLHNIARVACRTKAMEEGEKAPTSSSAQNPK